MAMNFCQATKNVARQLLFLKPAGKNTKIKEIGNGKKNT